VLKTFALLELLWQLLHYNKGWLFVMSLVSHGELNKLILRGIWSGLLIMMCLFKSMIYVIFKVFFIWKYIKIFFLFLITINILKRSKNFKKLFLKIKKTNFKSTIESQCQTGPMRQNEVHGLLIISFSNFLFHLIWTLNRNPSFIGKRISLNHFVYIF
jgi:hypothetical protein